MEILKTMVEDNILKLEIGIDYNEDSKELSGSIELDIENPDMIDHLELFFEVDGNKSEAIDIEVDTYVSIPNSSYYEFLDSQIPGDFIENVYLHIEIVDDFNDSKMVFNYL